jgi:hypothetical protein
MNQTIHTNLNGQGHRMIITIHLVQVIDRTVLETQATLGNLVAQEVQVDHRPGHPVVVEDK